MENIIVNIVVQNYKIKGRDKMGKNYSSNIRKITKLGRGTYFSERYSVGFYCFLGVCKFLLKLCFFWIYIPFKLLFKK